MNWGIELFSRYFTCGQDFDPRSQNLEKINGGPAAAG
jgi:hypothetical protein